MVVDELGRIPMSQHLAATLTRAASYADTQQHPEVTLEHLLLALIEDADAANVLRSSNIELARLAGEVSTHIGQIADRRDPAAATQVLISRDLKRILEAAAAAARQGRRSEINGAIVLAAIIGDAKSTAANLLRVQGLTFEQAIRALQRQASAPSHSEPAPSQPSASTESTEGILASARERVQSRTTQPPPAQSQPPSQPAPVAAEPVPQPRPNFPAPELSPVREPARPSYAPQWEPAAGAPPHATVPPQHDVPSTQPPLRTGPPTSPPRPMPGPPPGSASTAPFQMPPHQGGMAAPPSPLPHGSAGFPPQRPGPPPSSLGPQPNRGQPPAAAQPPRPSPGQQPSGAPPFAARTRRPGKNVWVAAGQLVENIPRRMRLGISMVVEARIGRKDVKAIAEGMDGGAAIVRHEVTVTKAMSVRLRAPDGGFFVESSSPETQWIEGVPGFDADYASWRWTITPRERGRRRLQLLVSARTVGEDGLTAETALPDQMIEVRVGVNYAKTATRMAGWMTAAVAGGVLARFGESMFVPLMTLISGSGG